MNNDELPNSYNLANNEEIDDNFCINFNNWLENSNRKLILNISISDSLESGKFSHITPSENRPTNVYLKYNITQISSQSKLNHLICNADEFTHNWAKKNGFFNDENPIATPSGGWYNSNADDPGLSLNEVDIKWAVENGETNPDFSGENNVFTLQVADADYNSNNSSRWGITFEFIHNNLYDNTNNNEIVLYKEWEKHMLYLIQN